jgi:glycosyltransferase involved in cell wall biosynthesis
MGIILFRALAEISMTKPFEQSEAGDSSISVALCAYNGARYLGEQLASIAAQTRKPSELVACDDGSSDETIALLEQFSSQVDYPVRIVRNQRKLGSTKNFEQAIGLCRGEFIALSDQDDWWNPKKLETMVRALQQHSAGGVFSDGALMDESSRLTGATLWGTNLFEEPDTVFNARPRDHAISELLKRNLVTGAALMFRADLRAALMPVPDEWVHDGWIAWMIVLHSRLIACSQPLIRYRIHSAQQVGMVGRSWVDRLRRARETGSVNYRQLERQFQVLHDYAQSHADVCGPYECERIEAKRRHSQFRAELSANRLLRLLRIAVQSSAYRLYAQGYLSMIKDALA